MNTPRDDKWDRNAERMTHAVFGDSAINPKATDVGNIFLADIPTKECPACGGTGDGQPVQFACDLCEGTGRVAV